MAVSSHRSLSGQKYTPWIFFYYFRSVVALSGPPHPPLNPTAQAFMLFHGVNHHALVEVQCSDMYAPNPLLLFPARLRCLVSATPRKYLESS